MLQDGFGDDLTVDEQVANYRKWSHFMAGKFVNASSLTYDDLVQESMIEIWKVLKKKDQDVPATYLTKAAKYKMISIVQGKPMTGGDSTPGPKSRPKELNVDWQEEPDEGQWSWTSLLAAPDLLSAVELAYHEGEILKALNELEPRDRQYVYSRFWEGKTDTEIAAELEVSNKYLGGRWKKQVRPKLLASLSHLAAL